jgi:hypothetical protein
MQLGEQARGWRGRRAGKRATSRAERRRLRQLKLRQLQFAPTKRRYLDWY